jgi:hypothetical protein
LAEEKSSAKILPEEKTSVIGLQWSPPTIMHGESHSQRTKPIWIFFFFNKKTQEKGNHNRMRKRTIMGSRFSHSCRQDFFFFFFFEKEKYNNKKKGIKDSGVRIKETRIKTENFDNHRTICSLIYLRNIHKNYEKRGKKKSNRKTQNDEKRK